MVVIVDAFIASLKVTLTVVPIATPVASATGETLVTVGGVVSGGGAAEAVVKLHE